MARIASGPTGWRGGRDPTTSLPVARLTHAQTFSIGPRDAYFRTDGTDLCMLVRGTREWPIEIDFTPLHFGGSRRWVLCPSCDARRQALYIDGDRVGCRACLVLRYPSQHKNTRDRLYSRVHAIRIRLKWMPGIANPSGPKPPRMHWRKFLRLVEVHDTLVRKLRGNVTQWLDRAEARLGYADRDIPVTGP